MHRLCCFAMRGMNLSIKRIKRNGLYLVVRRAWYKALLKKAKVILEKNEI
jgi:hypothetical protein